MANENKKISSTILRALDTAIAHGASDLHLKSACPPALRIDGVVKKIDLPIVSDAEIIGFVNASCLNAVYNAKNLAALDYSWVYKGIRFRCNAFRDMNGLCVSLRLLNIKTTEFSTLGIPEILKKLARRKSGLILVTGPTGSGKTTTLTCLIDYINSNFASHIIMLEDPIEYIHKPKKCIISQREIGVTSTSYNDAIIEALREDPDIILIGEMRDKESIATALTAAETGHLVLSTLHTKGAANTISRIVNVFSADEQNHVRMQLSLSLLGVVSQQLLPRKDKKGRVLATEVMVGTNPVQNLIRQQKIHMLNSVLDVSSNDGMYSMKQSLDDLLKRGIIEKSDYDDYQIS